MPCSCLTCKKPSDFCVLQTSRKKIISWCFLGKPNLFYLDDEITKQKEGYSGLSDEEKKQVENSIVGDDDEDDTTGPGPGKYQQQNSV